MGKKRQLQQAIPEPKRTVERKHKLQQKQKSSRRRRWNHNVNRLVGKRVPSWITIPR